jgi:hypothetical protein
MKNLSLYLVMLLLLHAGCAREIDWPLPGNPPDLIVVDAILTDETKAHQITLTRPVHSLNESPEPVTGATILISSEDSIWSLTEDSTGSGIYTTPADFHSLTGKTYTLQIFSAGILYSAKAFMVPGVLFDELTYVKNNNDDLYHIEWVADAFSPSEPAMWEILIDWSLVPGYMHFDPQTCKARLLFYTLPTLDVSEIFAPLMEKVSFPAGTIITERRYSLAPDHAAYIRELLLETNWQGSLFPTANANVATNLSTGATGYFGVCAVTSLSLIVTP